MGFVGLTIAYVVFFRGYYVFPQIIKILKPPVWLRK